jgi:hypothetical protein
VAVATNALSDDVGVGIGMMLNG